MVSKKNFETELMKHLSRRKLDKTTLKKYSSLVARWRKSNLKIENIFDQGIPAVDRVIVQGRVSIKDFSKLVNVMKSSEVSHLEMFPIGIPGPDYLDVNVTLGERMNR